jgi:Holliday junction resolvase RusA-like endonuclease
MAVMDAEIRDAAHGGPIVITLAGVPTGKGRPRFVKATARAYTPEKTRSYEDSLRLMGQVAMTGRSLIDGPVAIWINADFPVPASWSKKKRAAALIGSVRPCGKPDFDNLAKVCGDALNQIVWRDDSQIVEASITKRYSDKPSFTVKIIEVCP